jgi:tRNA(fMet)-specific endonuclease VapC
MLQHPKDAFFISIVSLHEQLSGWQAFLNRARLVDEIARGYRQLHNVLRDFSSRQVIGYDQQKAQVFNDLRRQKVRIGTMDLRIASTALFQRWTVLTRNSVDFEQVPGLLFDDWTISNGNPGQRRR